MPLENLTTDLAYWIKSREAVRCLKEARVPPPWTSDPAISTVRYCNIRREDDKVTRWIKDNWRDANVDHPNLVPAMVLARMVNWPETLEALGFPDEWNPTLIIDRLIARSHTGRKVWSAAYMITTCGKRMGKEEYVVGVADASRAVAADVRDADSLSSAHRLLTSVDGLGSFLAAQVLADLKNIPEHPLHEAPDWWTWSAHGPGSLKGLSEYFHRNVTPRDYEVAIKICYDDVQPVVEPYVGRLHMQDFQNCLCEFSKYVRFKRGGHVRNRYVAR